MIQPIVRDVMFLSCKSQAATAKDLPIARDLADTLRAHAHECVGMAANMIGVRKRIIAVMAGKTVLVMLNPLITDRQIPFAAQEGCLSLDGERPCLRYQQILVEYQDEQLQRHVQRFAGFTAQVIQHEVDHLEGIII